MCMMESWNLELGWSKKKFRQKFDDSLENEVEQSLWSENNFFLSLRHQYEII